MSAHREKGHKLLVQTQSNVSKLSSTCGCFIVAVYSVWILSSFVAADIHTYGSTDLNGEVMLNRRIIEHNTVEPRNYTVIFKYVRNKLGGLLSYVELNVENCPSTGNVDVHMDDGKREDTVITANLNVQNCSKLNVTAQIFGHGASIATKLATDPFIAEVFGEEIFDAKSFTLVYAQNAKRSKDRYIKIGRRQSNDALLKSEKINVSNGFNSFPQQEIEYIEPNTFITQMEFQFNSPTATAFLNSSFIGENHFNAVVYDLSRPQFTVYFRVYGYASSTKPSQYKSILAV